MTYYKSLSKNERKFVSLPIRRIGHGENPILNQEEPSGVSPSSSEGKERVS